jgi:pyruvate/2-oxoglutarate dehydrogenase complex dihydrolipoamide dehydrogenase (E3) component
MPSDDDDVSRRYDVVVIGAGPAGDAAAELGGSLGYSVALVERDTVGGTVITSGGAPTKTFREAAVYLSSLEKDKIYGSASEIAGTDALARLHRDVLRVMRLPSRAHRI